MDQQVNDEHSIRAKMINPYGRPCVLHDADVVLLENNKNKGRNNKANKQPGNQQLLSLVQQYSDEYEKADASGKHNFVSHIIATCKSRDAKFLLRVNRHSTWMEAKSEAVREAIISMLQEAIQSANDNPEGSADVNSSIGSRKRSREDEFLDDESNRSKVMKRTNSDTNGIANTATTKLHLPSLPLQDSKTPITLKEPTRDSPYSPSKKKASPKKASKGTPCKKKSKKKNDAYLEELKAKIKDPIDGKLYWEIRPVDVIMGRGYRANHHNGNLLLWKQVQSWRHDYAKRSKTGKREVVHQILDECESMGVRFLLRLDEESPWLEVKTEVAENKILNMLRDMSKNNKSTNEHNTATTVNAQEQEDLVIDIDLDGSSTHVVSMDDATETLDDSDKDGMELADALLVDIMAPHPEPLDKHVGTFEEDIEADDGFLEIADLLNLSATHEEGEHQSPSISKRLEETIAAVGAKEGDNDTTSSSSSSSSSSSENNSDKSSNTSSQGVQNNGDEKQSAKCVEDCCDLREMDVIMERGGQANTHPGNQKFLDMIRENYETYKHASKREKGEIVEGLQETFAKTNMRFLMRWDKKSPWTRAKSEVVREKIAHTLRDARRMSLTEC